MTTNPPRIGDRDLALEFAILGPLQVRRSGVDVRLAGVRQRTLLAALLLTVDRPVTVDRLIDLLWGDQPPASCRGDLQANVSRLRRLLAGDYGVRRSSVIHSAGGYLIPAGFGSLDLVEFDRLSAAAGKADHAAVAVDLLRQALGLWRGPPLRDVTPELARLAAPGVEERRLTCLERCLGLELGLGRHRQLVEELRMLVAEHPEREHLRGLLMRALARAGRRSAALEVYETGRRWLADELGIDPAPDVQNLHQAILRDDPALGEQRPEGQRAVASGVTPDRAGPRLLPYDVGDFTGRTAEIDRIVAGCDQAAQGRTVVISAINGMAGVGKTALAVHAAHRLADRFPGGQLFVDLHGHTPGTDPVTPEAALDTVLRVVGVPPEEVPEGLSARAARWRAEAAGRRLLVVLDDAASAEQVRPLLPGTPGCLVLVTSRRRLAGIDGASALSLDALDPAEARHLFALVAGDRATAEPTEVDRVVELCGHLPLAIRIAAARLAHRPAWTVGDLAARLRAEEHRLAELAVDDRSVANTFALSYRHLTAAQRRVFRLLGLHPGTDIDAYATAALCGLPRTDAERLLEDLLDANLLQQHQPGRYRFHDLVRHHAQAMAHTDETNPERELATGRVLDFYLHTAAEAMKVFDRTERRIIPDVTRPPTDVPVFACEDAATGWLERERPNLVRATHASSGVHAWQLPHLIRDFFHGRSHYSDWLTTHEHALEVSRRLADNRAEAITRLGLGFIYYRLAHLDDAVACYRRAIALRDVLDDPTQLATALNNLGYVYWPLGRYTEALTLHHQARSLFAAAGHGGGEAYALCCMGHVHAVLGNPGKAIGYQQRSLELTRQVGRCYGEAIMLAELGVTYCKSGHLDKAGDHLQRSLELSRTIDFRWSEIGALRGLGRLHSHQHHYADAITHYQQALQLAETSNDWSHEAGILNELGRTHHAAGNPADSLTCHQRALAHARRIGIQQEMARAAEGLGRIALDRADHDAARDHWQRALTIYDQLGLPAATRVRERLDLLDQGPPR